MLNFLRNKKLILLTLLLSSCQYQWNQEYNLSTIPTISIPYAKGDEDGTFTAELIRTISSLGIAKISKENPDFELQINLQDQGNQTIGYRWDKQKTSGELTTNIVACEARRSIQAECLLIDLKTNKPIGPYLLDADNDYDYVDGDCIHDLVFKNSEGIKTLVLPFSLGQLEPQEAAKDASTKPLYKRLSQKIADTLFSYL